MMKPHLRFPIKRLRTAALWMVAALFISMNLVTSVNAQSKNTLELLKPDFLQYPSVSTYFRAFDSTGGFIKNIETTNLRIQEDERVVVADSVDLLEPGVRFIVAVNEGPTLANRYSEVRRIDNVKAALTKWAKAQTVTSMSDFSLISNSGTQVSLLNDPSDWVEAIESYDPDMKSASPGLASLSSAVDLATTASESTQKTPAILYFTPLPTEDQMESLKEIINRAVQGNVHLFIWLAGPAQYAATEEADLLQQAAEDTKGAFFIFTGAEELPELSSYLDPLTYIYKLKYESQIKKSGEFTLSLRVTKDNISVDSEPVTFSLTVLPPNPIFLSPPSAIERTWTETKSRKDSVLAPDAASIQIMIEFPDGMERDLKYSRFFINNQLVDENISAPFDTFEWDISKINTSDTYMMSASIEDSAGFISQTVNLPIQVNVEIREKTWLESLTSAFSSQTTALILVIVVIGALLVFLSIRAINKNRAITNKISQTMNDPVTQPVMIDNELLSPAERKEQKEEWPHIPGIGLAPARLLLQSRESTESSIPAEIALGEHEVIIGSDPKKAKVILNSAAVSPIHAKIEKENADQFKVYDLGSGSGTWMNYAPVSIYGARLEHGDLIQFGKIAYRFEIYGAESKKMQVLPYQEEE